MYRYSNPWEKILTIVTIPFVIIWKLVAWFLSILKRLIVDIAKGVYGKLLTFFCGLIAVGILAFFISLIIK